MITIYHNPRCSKSRNTITLLEENNVDFDVVYYLETPPNANQLKILLTQLGISARDLIRRGEAEYKEQLLANADLSEDDLITAMVNTPKLIERPIVTNGNKAIIGRPPENLFELFR